MACRRAWTLIVTPEDFGALGVGADDHAALMAMADAGRANGSLTVNMRPGAVYVHQNPWLFAGIERLVINGNGAVIRNSRTTIDFDSNNIGIAFPSMFNTNGHEIYLGAGHPHNYGQRIAPATKGSSIVFMLDGTDAQDFVVGKWALVYGFNRQPNASFPPNMGVFQYVKVQNVSGAAVVFDEPLYADLLNTWPDDGTDGTANFGAARIISLHRPDFKAVEYLELNKLHIQTGNNVGDLMVQGCIEAHINGCRIDRNLSVGTSKSVTIAECYAGGYVETDKITDRVAYKRTTMSIHAQGGCKRLSFDDCNILASFSCGAIDGVRISGGNFRGKANGSNRAIMSLDLSCPDCIVDGVNFIVDDPQVDRLCEDPHRYSLPCTIGNDTLTFTPADWAASEMSYALKIGSVLELQDGTPAAEVASLPVEVPGGTLRMDASILEPMGASETLYLPAYNMPKVWE